MELLQKGASICLVGVYSIRHRKRTWSTDKRDISVFGYRLSGHSAFRTENTEIGVSAGDLIYIPAGMEYAQTSDGDRIIALHFMADGIEDNEIACFRNLPAEEFLRLYNEWSDGSADGRYRAQAHFLDLLARMAKESAGTRDARVEAAVKYIRAHMISPTLSVAQIAAAAGTSEVFLRRLMKRDLGRSPLRYLNELRIAAAKELLAGGYDSIESIAEKCGFSDGKYFAEAFRRATGMTASEYRSGKR